MVVAAVSPRALAARTLTTPARRVRVTRRGTDLIGQPLLNKGTAFPASERRAFGLEGLLPAHVATIDEQVALELEHVRRKPDDLERYIGLAALQDRNETLFYRLLATNLEEFLPIVYTPTVGRACQQFSHIFRRPRGVWITPDDVGRIDGILRTAGGPAIRLIVVTDNERILGLGDQGVGGIAIPVGKLTLYTAAAGIYPAATLPVSLDVGTDRQELLNDPLYLGYRAPRLRGAAYDAVVEAFVQAVERVCPRALIQWEDFKQHNALRILERYRHRILSFNDDVQGTGAVVLAGLLAARRSRGGIGHDRFLFLGAGAAALGIARLLARQLAAGGATPDEIQRSIAMIDSHGLVRTSRVDAAEDQRAFAIDGQRVGSLGLDEASCCDPVAIARGFRPTVLIGTTGTAGAFSEPLIRETARHHPEPIIMPLSNPSDRAEARPEEILRWTEGRALVATGSPFGPVESPRGRRLVGQANNVFIFPGFGLGAIVGDAAEVTDDAFLVAAQALAELTTDDRLAAGALYPSTNTLREVSRTVAIALVRHLRNTGAGRWFEDDAIEPAIDAAMWSPEYLPYDPA